MHLVCSFEATLAVDPHWLRSQTRRWCRKFIDHLVIIQEAMMLKQMRCHNSVHPPNEIQTRIKRINIKYLAVTVSRRHDTTSRNDPWSKAPQLPTTTTPQHHNTVSGGASVPGWGVQLTSIGTAELGTQKPPPSGAEKHVICISM